MNPQNGKGDGRRPENTKAVHDNWVWEDPFERRMAQKRKEEAERRIKNGIQKED